MTGVRMALEALEKYITDLEERNREAQCENDSLRAELATVSRHADEEVKRAMELADDLRFARHEQGQAMRDRDDMWLRVQQMERAMAEKDALLSQAREGIAWAYQYAGANDAPEYVLDNLSAISRGEAPPHPWKAAERSPAVQQMERQIADRDALLAQAKGALTKIAETEQETIKQASELWLGQVVIIARAALASIEELARVREGK